MEGGACAEPDEGEWGDSRMWTSSFCAVWPVFPTILNLGADVAFSIVSHTVFMLTRPGRNCSSLILSAEVLSAPDEPCAWLRAKKDSTV